MSSLKIPHISDYQIQTANRYAERQRAQRKRKWIRENILSIIAIIIAALSLIVSILSFTVETLPLLQPAPDNTQSETAQPEAENAQH